MDDTSPPRLPKIPFIAADVILVLLAIVIRYLSPESPVTWFWVIFCVALGGILACLPFYVEFKSHMKLAEYDKSQANFEIAERVEQALATMGQVGQNIGAQIAQGEQNAKAVEGLLNRFDARIDAIEERLSNDSPDGHTKAELSALSERIGQVAESLSTELKAAQKASHTDLKELLAQTTVQMREALDKTSALSVTEIETDIAAELSTLSGRVDELAKLLMDTTPEVQSEGNVEIVDFSEEQPKHEESEPEPEASTEPLTEETDVVEDEDAVIEDELEAIEEESEHEEKESDDEADISFLSEEDEAELESDDEGETEDDSSEEANDSDEEELENEEKQDEEADSEDVDEDEAEEEAEEEEDAAAEEEETPDKETETKEDESGEEDKTEEEGDQPSLLDVPESSAKAKKAGRKETSLVAQVLIGIGNKPYVRGEGPGLSMEEGIPMEFLEIGKWQWIAPETSEPITIILYKNDQVPAEGEPIVIEPGQKRTITPRFQ